MFSLKTSCKGLGLNLTGVVVSELSLVSISLADVAVTISNIDD